MTGEDTDGHLYKRGIELEVDDDTAANMLRAATDRGEPVYVRFPDGAEVQGHKFRWAEGHWRGHRGPRRQVARGHATRG